MRIDQVTKYRCDGCGAERENPINWLSLVPLMAMGGSYPMTIGRGQSSRDYCERCSKKMSDALQSSTACR